MTCPACHAAEKNPITGLYGSDCDECRARAIAHGQDLYRSAKAGYMTPEYKRALTAVFGSDGLDAGHQRVKGWAAKINTHLKTKD
jgi:hypothetical protein